MVKKRGIVWNYYNKKVDGSQVIAFCKFCNQSYIQNATRMERHMERCQKCPETIRQQFIQVAHSKKNKGMVTTNIKKNDTWPNQEPSIEPSNISDTQLEDLDEWGYRNQIYNDASSNNTQSNVEVVIQSETQWTNRDEEMHNTEASSNTENNRDWEANRAGEETGSTGKLCPGSQERGATIREKRASFGSRRLAPCSILSMRSATHSLLQNKIHQEELLEKRAARCTAELELRRKTLELERFQWEYERDKVQSELRWAHETRMMQLKEERERQIIDQSRTRLPDVM
ncbi:uncharacterized protein LOC105685390 [Athalia rosae]|uniref:uncharacterized protein LOC105685390 n=1 Tax=Athalia rosae TaxID=37344 RepID=UPI00203479FB|nr:uncharacterized protein LOC105685390 [Athalia rosae]